MTMLITQVFNEALTILVMFLLGYSLISNQLITSFLNIVYMLLVMWSGFGMHMHVKEPAAKF